MNTGWPESDVRDTYLLVEINFVPSWASTVDEYDVAMYSCDATDQLEWRHNFESEKTVLGDNGEMNDRLLFSVR